MAEHSIYSLRQLTHRYDRHPTLDIGALDIPEGGVVGLIGPNGSGKSTLLKILAFLIAHKSGELLFDGVSARGREQELRRHVTLLLQEPYLMRRTVAENIAYGLRLRGCPSAEIEALTADSLERVGLAAGDFRKRPWFRLSGGEVQRVSLAVRLALKPRVLLLDEPTANVDEASATRIKEAVWHAWRDWGTTIVVATHDLVWLYEVATKIVSLYRGRFIGDGATNLVQGEWRVQGDFALLSLRNQTIRASSPPRDAAPACATLAPSDIVISTENQGSEACAAGDGENALRGVLTQMSIERATGQILCVVDCDGLFLRARLSLDAAHRNNLYPGLGVYLTFAASSLNFI